jgi:hypothetical protein
MTEVPFAWWHKCMALKSRTFASRMASVTFQGSGTYGIIVCEEWKTKRIDEEVMQLDAINYEESDASRKLLRVQGGITSQMVEAVLTLFKKTLTDAVREFVGGGSPSNLETSPESILRKGAPEEFNMKCFSKTRFPANVTAYKKQVFPVDCILRMLSWIHNENSDPSRFLPGSFTGMHPSCFSYDAADLVSLTGSNRLSTPFDFLLRNTVDSDDSFFLEESVSMNDFFVGTNNKFGLGLLVAELKPVEPPQVGFPFDC